MILHRAHWRGLRPRGWPLVAGLTLVCLGGCRDLDRFDTSGGDAYCGAIVSGQFVRSTEEFRRDLRMRVTLDTDRIDSVPGTLTTDDAADGPCKPRPTFDGAELRAIPEVQNDALSLLEFDDAQEQNLVTWVDSRCRGTMLAVVSLLKTDGVEVRLLKPAPAPLKAGDPEPAFALFELERRHGSCGF